MSDLMEMALTIAKGFSTTIYLLCCSFVLGLVIAIPVAFLRYQKICKWLLNAIVSFLRGTPLILQLAIVYFTVPGVFGCRLSIVAAGILTFGINSSAYIAEILRAGLESLPIGQFEAAKTLRVPTYYMWKDIILPQVVRNIFPALVNESISLLKETALIATIGGLDIMRTAQLVTAERFTYFEPLCIAALYYYALALTIEKIGKRYEKRLRYHA